MSLRSWLSSSPRSLSHQRSGYELPLYNHEPLPAAFPPPPVTASVYQTPDAMRFTVKATSPTASPQVSNDMLLLQRRERVLQQTLQELLDEQADGLMAGLGGREGEAESASNGSFTPTISSIGGRSSGLGSPPARGQNTARRRKIGLSGARRGIYRRILDCAELKSQEDGLLQVELEADRRTLGQLQAWSHKHEGLKKEIERIETEDAIGQRMAAMKDEAQKLSSEISDMEIRLMELKAKHRALESQMSDLKNNTDCELASWKSSLKMLNDDVGAFLTHPPPRAQDRQADPFLALPPHRRTLDMAQEHWKSSLDETKARRQVVRRDQRALMDGAAVWKEVLMEIRAFENKLKSSMQPDLLSTDPENTMREILQEMDGTINRVAEKHTLAQSRKWNLLIACIGAELEALHQGQMMLQQTIDKNDLEDGPDGLLESTIGPEGLKGGVSVLPVATKPKQQQQPTTPVFKGTTGFRDKSNEAHVPSSSPRSSPPLIDNPHSAALHTSMYDTDDDPDPDLMMAKSADSDVE